MTLIRLCQVMTLVYSVFVNADNIFAQIYDMHRDAEDIATQSFSFFEFLSEA